jgi:hypothetical protein
MPYQVELTDKQVSIVADVLEFYSRFMWGQLDHLPASLEAAPRMKEIYGDQIWHAMLPFRTLV